MAENKVDKAATRFRTKTVKQVFDFVRGVQWRYVGDPGIAGYSLYRPLDDDSTIFLVVKWHTRGVNLMTPTGTVAVDITPNEIADLDVVLRSAQ